MKDPEIQTKVVHSQTKQAWNVVCENIGKKYKIARVPYFVTDKGENDITSFRNKTEAFDHAQFISYCFNHSKQIIEL